MDTDLISFDEDRQLAALLRSSDSNTQKLLGDKLQREDLEELLALSLELEDTSLEAAGLRIAPDPTLPEIVLLHGITDCHLADTSGLRDNRIWFQFNELVRGSFSKNLPLQEDGISDLSGKSLRPDGHLGKKYNKTLRAWAAERFRTNVFCYDWRKSVHTICRDFRFVSFNSPLYPERREGHPRLPFHGRTSSLLLGCQPLQLGRAYPTLRLCGLATRRVLQRPYERSRKIRISKKKWINGQYWKILMTFKKMLASFPGLIDMLPNPNLFPDAADLYSQKGWPGSIRPQQDQLDASLALKNTIWTSPIFAKSTHLVSQGHETITEMALNAENTDRNPSKTTMLADGSVPTLSSLAPGLRAFRISGEHGMLVNERKVAEAVMQIARGELPSLHSISEDDLKEEKGIENASDLAGLRGSPIQRRQKRERRKLRQELARRELSEETYNAEFEEFNIEGFERLSLRQTAFSWKNALSMAIASNEAYASHNPLIAERAKNQWGFDGYHHFDADDTQGFICWDNAVVVLSFRGTEQNLADWLRNFNFLVSHDTGSHYGEIHRGFYQGYEAVAPEIVKVLRSIKASEKKLYLTGHSLGGALATIAGAELRSEFSPDAFYTFGQPKTGKEQLKTFYQTHFAGKFFRFRNDRDIVTRIPPNYTHLGHLLWFDSKGNLKHPEAGALRSGADDSLELQAEATELSEEQFRAYQDELDQMSKPNGPHELRLLPTREEIDQAEARGLSLAPSSAKDHSMKEQYIPLVRRYAEGANA